MVLNADKLMIKYYGKDDNQFVIWQFSSSSSSSSNRSRSVIKSQQD